MKITYLTVDEVNQSLTRDWAHELALLLEIAWPLDRITVTGKSAALYDLDSLPVLQREEIVKGLLAVTPPVLVAVHSYALPGNQAQVLRGGNVTVCRWFERKVLQRLRDALVLAIETLILPEALSVQTSDEDDSGVRAPWGAA